MTDSLLKEVCLSEGLTLKFHEAGNRYFGDYHRVLIEIDAYIETAEQQVVLRYRHPLKKMAVAGDVVTVTKQELISQFLATVGPYMRQSGFVEKVLRSLTKPGQQVWRRL